MPPTPAPAASGIRGCYETLGVQGYYEQHGSEYLNPHDDQIVKAIALLMDSQEFTEQPGGGTLRVLDLACGSGEATLALHAWASWRRRQQAQQQQQQQPQERQQAQPQQQQRPRQQSSACPPPQLDITACDPYTQQAYERRTGGSAHPWSYQDIADGCLAGRAFDLCVCSFALHLCEPSCLFITLWQLACHCRWLAVLAPHKQPSVREEHGWAAVRALKVERVHVRLYRSLNWGQPQE